MRSLQHQPVGVSSMVLLLLVASADLSWGQGAEPQKNPRVELSLRSWLFTAGETRWSHDASGLDPRLGDPTSKLVYNDNDTHIIELGGKVHFGRRGFVRAEGGFSVSFDRGLLVDDDFTAVGGQHIFSRTHSDISGSGTQYGRLDLGFRAAEFTGSRGYVDVFAGFQYWRTRYEATGVRQEICTPSGIPGLSCTPNLNLTGVTAITNTAHWITPIHIGVETEYHVTRRVSLDFKVSVSPVSLLYNEDVHHLRSDLQQDPSFSMWGIGVGATAGAGVKFSLTGNLALTGGYRVMWNRTYDGEWKNHPIGGGTDRVSLNEFQTIRHGVLIGLTGSF
ncbi:MAG: hypothetical protein IPM58_14550 [Nitrospira sp.]|nr:hypothetical protein [Nitrospira sp.]